MSSERVACKTACDYIRSVAWESKTFRPFDLHRLCYREVRGRFHLTAQAAVGCISKVPDAYKLDRNRKRRFRPTGSAACDTRILRFRACAVSIWSLDGRLNIPFVCGHRQRGLLATQEGESDLALVRGQWLLLATCVIPEAKNHGRSSHGH